MGIWYPVKQAVEAPVTVSVISRSVQGSLREREYIGSAVICAGGISHLRERHLVQPPDGSLEKDRHLPRE
jgi:hypothetical protein